MKAPDLASELADIIAHAACGLEAHGARAGGVAPAAVADALLDNTGGAAAIGITWRGRRFMLIALAAGARQRGN
jgi:hypothetical protein